jgi:hypothetical protein
MINNEEYTEYRDRQFILDRFPISNKSYNNRVTKLDLPEYSEFTKIVKFGKRLIHESVLKKLFLPERLPNQNQPHQVKKWVQLNNWDYIGNFTPTDTDIRTNVELVLEFRKLLKKINKNLTLFYSIERGTNIKETYHTHFLIKSSVYLNRSEIWSNIKENDLLIEFLKKEHKTNSKFWFEPYDYKTFDDRGIEYTIKYDIKCGLLK